MTNRKKDPMIPPEPGADLEEHPLLPGDDERPPPKIRQFYVCRQLGADWETAPRTVRPDELQSMEELYALFGGGTYLLKGHDGRKWVAPFGRHLLSGPPKPMAPRPEPATPSPAAAPALPTGGGEMGGMMPLLITLIQGQQTMMAAIVTAAMAPKPEPKGDSPITAELLRALIARGGTTEDMHKMFAITTGAWKEGMSQGTEVAKIAAEAATGPAAEPSAFDQALDKAAPVVLEKLVAKAMG